MTIVMMYMMWTKLSCSCLYLLFNITIRSRRQFASNVKRRHCGGSSVILALKWWMRHKCSILEHLVATCLRRLCTLTAACYHVCSQESKHSYVQTHTHTHTVNGSTYTSSVTLETSERKSPSISVPPPSLRHVFPILSYEYILSFVFLSLRYFV